MLGSRERLGYAVDECLVSGGEALLKECGIAADEVDSDGLRRLFEMHGFSHPGRACVNAEQVFHITKKEQSIISSHMWPLTFRHVPTCREAVIVCLADKYCAVVESMFRRAKAAATVGADETDETLW